MRPGGTLAIGKWAAAVAVLAVAVAGWGFGDDAKPQPIRPVAANGVAQEKAAGQLILTLREEVRYFSPTGEAVQRIHYETAKKADPDLLTGQVELGLSGLAVRRYLPS